MVYFRKIGGIVQPIYLSWTDRLTIIGLSLTIICITWTLHRDHVKHAKESAKEWKELLAKLHDHDKDLHIIKNDQ